MYAFRCGDVLVGSGSVGACRGVELSLLLFVIGGKITEWIPKKQEKLRKKYTFFEKSVKKQLLGLSIECVQVLRELHRAPLAEQFLVRTCLDVGGALDGSAESASTFEAFHLLFQIIL